ncbi:hypothetical protein B0H13DRAFT_1864956 [Mycena leptocephala]|nr:hypothetical protein B0H13DRAFT_1864956 [Mycena leptocephala]
MSSSSTPATSSNPFMKRRRAYVACTNCRKRKIKCVTVSEVDYRPCTRCAKKGLQCEYFAVPGDYSTQPDTPPPENQAPRQSDSGWIPQPITPPSAGINDYLGGNSSSSMGVRSGTVPPAAGGSRYPYRSRPAPVPAAPVASTSNASWAQQPPPQQYSSTYPQAGYAPMQQHPGAAAPRYYSGTPYIPAPNAGHGGGPFYGQNYGQSYLPQAQPGGWPQAIAFAHPDRATAVLI